jgi:hypothetical protein
MYKVLSARNHKELETQVNSVCENGFQPTGGIAIIAGPLNSAFFFQAVVSVPPADLPVAVELPAWSAEIPVETDSENMRDALSPHELSPQHEDAASADAGSADAVKTEKKTKK